MDIRNTLLGWAAFAEAIDRQPLPIIDEAKSIIPKSVHKVYKSKALTSKQLKARKKSKQARKSKS